MLAMMALNTMPSGKDWMTAGVSWNPSMAIAMGAKMQKDMMVKILKRLMLSRPAFPAT